MGREKNELLQKEENWKAKARNERLHCEVCGSLIEYDDRIRISPQGGVLYVKGPTRNLIEMIRMRRITSIWESMKCVLWKFLAMPATRKCYLS